MANPSSLANLRPFQPGNPGGPGRPRKRPVSEAHDDLARAELPDSIRIPLKLKKGSTWADAYAMGQARKAIAGDTAAAKEIRESIEGKSVQRVELSSAEDRRVEVCVTYANPVAPRQLERVVDERIIDQVVEEEIVRAVTDEKEKES